MRATRSRASMHPLSIHVDVVAVEGLAMTAAQLRQFQRALQAELHRLATERAGSGSWAYEARAAERAPQVRLDSAYRAAELGTDVGRSLWGVIEGAR